MRRSSSSSAAYEPVPTAAGDGAASAAGRGEEDEEGDPAAAGSARLLHTSEMSTSLTAQVLMYYHCLLSLVYGLVEGGLVIVKLKYYVYRSDIDRILLAPLFILWVLAEVARLYSGFTGNLREMVPQMSVFLLLTIFPQFLLVLYVTAFQEFSFPADRILGGLQLSMLLLELYAGYGGLRAITTKRTAQFYRTAQEDAMRRRDHHD